MKLKIQSISDIITNSSSEIFTMYTRSEIKLLKDVISEIFDEDFDNLFVLEYEIKDSNDFYTRENQEQSYEDWALEHDENLDCDETPYVRGIYIKAKNSENYLKAKALNTILNLFEKQEIYC